MVRVVSPTVAYAAREVLMNEHAQHTMSVPPPRRSRTSWGLVLFAVASLAGAGGAGYYAWQLWKDNASTQERIASLEQENKDLSEALSKHQTDAEGINTQLSDCKEELELEKTALASAKEETTKLGTELATCQSSITDLEAQRKEAEAQLKEFAAITEKFRKMIDTGKLEVEFRRGQMVVKLPAAILFDSGSAALSPDGETALAEVAAVLKTVPKRRFIVAGHTDNVPLGKDDEFKSNWELSAARAVTVTEMLIQKGMKPSNLVAAGYGPYAPVASNNSKAGRQKNRRIEIIVEPDLSKLPINKLAEKSSK